MLALAVAIEAVVAVLMVVLVDVEGSITALVLPSTVASLDWVGVISGCGKVGATVAEVDLDILGGIG